MSKKKSTLSFILLLIFLLTAFTGCDPLNTTEQPSQLRLTLIDSPGDYEEVNIEILEVNIKIDEGEWLKMGDFKSGIYNLLDFTGGNELLISDTVLAQCMLSQVRLILGTNNTIKVGGNTVKLNTPSGQESGIKLYVNQAIPAGSTNNIVFDFDASSSVVKQGNTGLYLLKPVIRVFNTDNTGSIKGKVLPADLNVAIQVNSNGKVIATSYAPAGSPDYLIAGLPEGVYMVIFDPGADSGFSQFATEENIVVTNGQTKDIGSITLNPE